jgi:Phage integrase, N-terminal SAM-like domain
MTATVALYSPPKPSIRGEQCAEARPTEHQPERMRCWRTQSSHEAASRSGGGPEPGTDLAGDQGDLLGRECLAGDLQGRAQRTGVKDGDAVHQELTKPRQAGDVDAQHRVDVQVGAEAEGLGHLGGLPPQRLQRPIKGPAAMPQMAAGGAQVAAVAFGVDHIHPGGAVRPTTWATYRIYAQAQVVPVLGHVPLQALTAAHLNRLYADLAEHGRRDGRGGLKPKSVRHVHVLHKALGDAVRWGLVARNVADAADPPRIPRRERGVWSAEELRAFLEATSEDRLAAMWLLFATTGMRRSELLGLPWRAVDLEASPGRLAVVQTVVVVDKRPVIVAEGKTPAAAGSLPSTPSPWLPQGAPGPAARGALGVGAGLGRHRPGVHPRGRPGPAP